MDYMKLGDTGLDVSRLCIGCLTVGDLKRCRRERTLDEGKSRPRQTS